MLPDESFPSYFLDVFGRPQRISACECERVSEANLAQALHLLNSDEIQGKLARAGRPGRAAGQGPAARRREGGGAVPVGLRPQAERRTSATLALAHIAKHATNKKVAYENILWALHEHQGVRVQPVERAGLPFRARWPTGGPGAKQKVAGTGKTSCLSRACHLFPLGTGDALPKVSPTVGGEWSTDSRGGKRSGGSRSGPGPVCGRGVRRPQRPLRARGRPGACRPRARRHRGTPTAKRRPNSAS